jgi:hypothetical protein
MTTLLAVYSSDGCEGRCDARCYDAQEPACTCCCNGANHGKGRTLAEAQTMEWAATWLAQWRAVHGDAQAELNPQPALPFAEFASPGRAPRARRRGA